MAKSITVVFDNGYTAEVIRDPQSAVVVKLREVGGQASGFVAMSKSDTNALCEALQHFR